MANAALSINTEIVINTVVGTVIAMAIGAIGKAALSWATREKQRLAAQQHKKVPMKLRTWTAHFLVMACLLAMLQMTMEAAREPAAPLDIALIAAWIWAVLSFLLHIVRSGRG